jgi:hypothetical protein
MLQVMQQIVARPKEKWYHKAKHSAVIKVVYSKPYDQTMVKLDYNYINSKVKIA